VQQFDLCAPSYSSGTTGVSERVVTLGLRAEALLPHLRHHRHLLHDVAIQGHGSGDGPLRPALVAHRVMFAPVVPLVVKNPVTSGVAGGEEPGRRRRRV
jgi:hypothetical protein